MEGLVVETTVRVLVAVGGDVAVPACDVVVVATGVGVIDVVCCVAWATRVPSGPANEAATSKKPTRKILAILVATRVSLFTLWTLRRVAVVEC